MKPFLKFAAVFVAGFLACLALNTITANRYYISTSGSRSIKIDRVTGDTWTYIAGQWVAISTR